MATNQFSFTLADTNAAIRLSASNITETLARGRDVIQQAREAMVKANLVLDGQGDHTPKRPSP